MGSPRSITLDGVTYPSLQAAAAYLKSKGLRPCEIAVRMGLSQSSIQTALKPRKGRKNKHTFAMRVGDVDWLERIGKPLGLPPTQMAQKLLSILRQEPELVAGLLRDEMEDAA